jgi:hypothetical protein
MALPRIIEKGSHANIFDMLTNTEKAGNCGEGVADDYFDEAQSASSDSHDLQIES